MKPTAPIPTLPQLCSLNSCPPPLPAMTTVEDSKGKCYLSHCLTEGLDFLPPPRGWGERVGEARVTPRVSHYSQECTRKFPGKAPPWPGWPRQLFPLLLGILHPRHLSPYMHRDKPESLPGTCGWDRAMYSIRAHTQSHVLCAATRARTVMALEHVTKEKLVSKGEGKMVWENPDSWAQGPSPYQVSWSMPPLEMPA